MLPTARTWGAGTGGADDPGAGVPVDVWIMHFVGRVLFLLLFAMLSMRFYCLVYQGAGYVGLFRRVVRLLFRGYLSPGERGLLLYACESGVTGAAFVMGRLL